LLALGHSIFPAQGKKPKYVTGIEGSSISLKKKKSLCIHIGKLNYGVFDFAISIMFF